MAPQALFLLNNGFVREQAEAAAKRLPAGEDRARIVRTYRLVLGRVPSEGETAAALKHVAGAGESAWATLFQALFASPDFRYVR